MKFKEALEIVLSPKLVKENGLEAAMNEFYGREGTFNTGQFSQIVGAKELARLQKKSCVVQRAAKRAIYCGHETFLRMRDGRFLTTFDKKRSNPLIKVSYEFLNYQQAHRDRLKWSQVKLKNWNEQRVNRTKLFEVLREIVITKGNLFILKLGKDSDENLMDMLRQFPQLKATFCARAYILIRLSKMTENLEALEKRLIGTRNLYARYKTGFNAQMEEKIGKKFEREQEKKLRASKKYNLMVNFGFSEETIKEILAFAAVIVHVKISLREGGKVFNAYHSFPNNISKIGDIGSTWATLGTPKLIK